MSRSIECSVKNLQQLINTEVLTKYQWQIVFTCFALVLLDGLDIAIIAYLAPLIRTDLGLETTQLPYLFSSGVLGLMIGSLLFGPLADRYGRKNILILSSILFAIFTIACGFAPNFYLLVICRFLTGLGLGGAMPISLSLCTEYMPLRHRMILSTLAWCGFTLGIAFGGIFASLLVSSLGWRGLFILTGAIPLLFLFLVARVLPESLEFLVRNNKASKLDNVQGIVDKLYTGKYKITPSATVHNGASRQPIKMLFSPQHRLLTLALWVAFFGSLLLFYLLTFWTPILLGDLYSFAQTNFITMMLPIGGTVGAFVLARWIDKQGKPFLRLASAYFAAGFLLLFFPSLTAWHTALILIVFLIGFTIAGAQNGLNLVAATVYDTRMRATGVSWAMAIGRLGSIVGSYIGIYMVSSEHPMRLFVYLATIGLACACALFVVSRSIAKQTNHQSNPEQHLVKE
ncbi:4-hydroxybenzoate transporter PcaK [Oligella sp. MSHR50489EDL]|uniref:MFS transporter n=1 Tax=Oligella sp. MSHR50489EDL TaxID=3139409 RepID=UPI003D818965